LSHAADIFITQITFIISWSVCFFASMCLKQVFLRCWSLYCCFAYNGDTRRAYYSTFDRASSRRASMRRDASSLENWAKSLAGTTTAPRDRFREIFLLVSILTFRPAAPPLLLLRYRTHRPHFHVRKSSRDSRVVQHSASLSHVNDEFDNEMTTGRIQGVNDR